MMENKILLITYPDSLGKNLEELEQVLDCFFKEAVESVHILPFFPSTADRGFAPVTYEKVDDEFGTWEDIKKLAGTYPIAADFMINHVSRYSEFFCDFQKNKDASIYKDFFVRYKDFWKSGEPTREQLDLLYKRKPKDPYEEILFEDGTKEKLWCTFSSDQIDLNFQSEVTKAYIRRTLEFLAEKGLKMVRLDAFGYTSKYENTSCFFVEPYIWDVLAYCRQILEPLGVEMLPELHSHYSKRLMLAQRGYWVYDFALPMLVLHALYTGNGKRLSEWIRIAPKKQFTTLDTHDGIGVIDVEGLLSQEEIQYTVDYLREHGANMKHVYTGDTIQNLDIYQINCTYYSALEENDQAYLLARALQFFTPGIPQVYYVGMLCGKNDWESLALTKEGRSINRHNYTKKEIETELERPVVKKLLEMMKFRNHCSAFEGTHTVECCENHMHIKWVNEDRFASLNCDLKTFEFEIQTNDGIENFIVH